MAETKIMGTVVLRKMHKLLEFIEIEIEYFLSNLHRRCNLHRYFIQHE